MWRKLFNKPKLPMPSHYPELETPKTELDFSILSNTSLNNIHTKLTSNSKLWQLVTNQDGILLEECLNNNTTTTSMRATCVLQNLNLVLDNLAQELFAPTLEQRKKIYDELLHHEIIRYIDKDTVIIYSQYKSPSLISNRDFYCLWSRRELPFGWLFSVESLNTQEINQNPDFVRGTTSSGMLIEQIKDNSYKLIMIEQIDPRGWVPNKAMNIFKKKLLQRLALIKSLYTNPNQK